MPRTHRYIAFYKPYRVLSAMGDGQGRAVVGDHIPIAGLHAAGRLDYDSEGLMLLTDDGALSHRLTDPRYEHPKVYWVQVDGQPDDQALEALRRGVWIKGQRTRPAQAERLDAVLAARVPPRAPPVQPGGQMITTWLRIALREGRKRQIRHMTAAVGHPTLRLIRMEIGPLALGDLAPGAWRELSPSEVSALKLETGLSEPE